MPALKIWHYYRCFLFKDDIINTLLWLRDKKKELDSYLILNQGQIEIFLG